MRRQRNSTAVPHPVLQWYHARPLCEVVPTGIMRDFINNSGNYTKAIKGLKTFEGKTPATVRDWHKKLAVVLGVTRLDIVNLIKRQLRPTEETTINSTGILSVLAGFDRANEDLFAILYLLRETSITSRAQA